jgi:glycosyltransferase involved in cell wall biosynthesis
MLKSLRQWDYLASQRHDITLANSKNVAKRIKKYYGLESEIVYPNVDIDRFNKEINTKFENSPCYPFGINNYYIIISALTEFKRIDISIEAFNKMNNKNLIVV